MTVKLYRDISRSLKLTGPFEIAIHTRDTWLHKPFAKGEIRNS
jgi:hypothetical protein